MKENGAIPMTVSGVEKGATGTAEQALGFALSGSVATGDIWDFLTAWSESVAFEEYPEFREWVAADDAQRSGPALPGIADLSRVQEMLALAEQHEARAVELSRYPDGGSVAKCAHHFAIAAGLRGRARFAK